MHFAGSWIYRLPGVAASKPVAAMLLGCAILGCGANPPAGAQIVRVTRTGDQVSVDPSTTRAGEIWLEFPDEGATLVTRGFNPFEPLSDEDIAGLGGHDTQGLTMSQFSPHESRYGRFDLKAGKYAFVVFDDVDPVGRPPHSIAILEVLP
jgi:hypothetical protein